MDLAQAREWHLSQLLLKRRSPATARLYGLYEQVFLDYLEGQGLGVGLDMLNVDNIEDCLRWMRATATRMGKRGGAAAEKAFSETWRRLSRLLWRRRVYAEDPLGRMEGISLQKLEKEPFSQEQARRLLMAASESENAARDRALLLLMADTGCRVGELCSATLDDMDEDRGAIVFRHTKGGVPRVVSFRVTTKRNGGRTLVAIREWLRVRRAEPGVYALFTTRDGLPLLPGAVRGLHRRLGAIVGIEDCHPHLWRHTAISEVMAEIPGAREAVAKRVGQTKLLPDYVHITQRQAEKVSQVASLSERWDL